ncbi:MAG TPA: TadE family protein [Nevskiaceae bacterium]|nr:TadE family protein [Nevskiaceae bacterium]
MTVKAGRKAQSGAAAVEFAFVFPILFLLMYGVVVYAYTFVLQESISFAAQEAAEAAVAVDPHAANPDALRDARVRAAAVAILNWLPAAQKSRVTGTSGEQVQIQYCAAGSGGLCPPDTDGVIVTLHFNMTTPDNLFPVLSMPLIGTVPPLPTQLTAQAVARV